MNIRTCVLGLAILIGGAGAWANVSIDFPEKSQLQTDVDVTSRFVYNVFYDYDRNLSDGVLAVRPEIRGNTKPSDFFFAGRAVGLYEQYLKNTVQNHFDFEGSGDIFVNEGGRQAFTVSGRYKNFSELAPNEVYPRIPRSVIEGEVKAKLKGDRGNSFDLLARYRMDQFNNTLFNGTGLADPSYLSNNTIEGSVQYNNNFLPETAWILRASGGQTLYPNPQISMPNNTGAHPKEDSLYVSAETGFVGRLTEKSTVDFVAGYLVRMYTSKYDIISIVGNDIKGESFSGPVFHLHFTEQITRRDQLIAGYNYLVKDSYFTNYLIDQEIYIGLARVMGDQVLILTRIGYNYRSYFKPYRRDDERIAGGLVIKYSLSAQIKLTAEIKVDLLSSDGYFNGTSTSTTSPTTPNGVPYTAPDRPASYKAGSFGLGLVASF
jgi:hypothetical protein